MATIVVVMMLSVVCLIKAQAILKDVEKCFSTDALSAIQTVKTQHEEDINYLKKIIAELKGNYDKLNIRLEEQARLLVPSTSLPPNSDVIAFYAHFSQTIVTLSQGHTLIFDLEITNVGNAYNNSTGVFLVPKSGWYVFSWSIRYYKAGRATEIMVNQAVMGILYTRQSTDEDDQTASQTVVLHVNQGDDVFIRSHKTLLSYGYVYSDGFGRSTFAGWKLG